jgi:hypothetical protein
MASPRKPDRLLVWQAALIVLPVAILAGTALYFLREDRASIERDARERVAAVAPELVRLIGERIAGLRNAGLQGEISGGRIISPPDHEDVPVPAEWPAQLTPGQVPLWQAAQTALHQQQDPVGARRALTQFAESGVDAEARANAEYWLLLTEGKKASGARYLDLARRSVLRDGAFIHLTPTEYGLLEALVSNAEGRHQQALLGQHAVEDDGVVRVPRHVQHLNVRPRWSQQIGQLLRPQALGQARVICRVGYKASAIQ